MPLIDFRRDERQIFEADVCIIGSGAAGLTLAERLASPSCAVVVLESGGRAKSGEADVLLRGSVENSGFTGLTAGRAKALGGTTRLWSGGCLPLDSSDFKRRDWVPWSGWPFGIEELEPFYVEADKLLKLRMADATRGRLARVEWPAQSTLLRTQLAVYCPEREFPRLLRASLKRLSIQVLLNATVTNISLDKYGSRAESADVTTLGGKRALVKASIFVLCCGAIDNARLLLCSNSVMTNGLGNDRDLVGRFLQDHPACFSCSFESSDALFWTNAFSYRLSAGRLTWTRIAASIESQQREGMLNAYAHVVTTYRARWSVAHRSLERRRDMVLDNATDAQPVRRVGMPSRHTELLKQSVRAALFKPCSYRLRVVVEQAPNPCNRVTLSHDRDEVAMAKAKIHWSVGELERKTVSKLTAMLFAKADGAYGPVSTGLKRFEAIDPSELRFEDTYHHAGTTRMSDLPSNGVVDRNLKVHGIDNLYVCGGSVMPASGAASPTFTIVALALRLGEHLGTVLKRTVTSS